MDLHLNKTLLYPLQLPSTYECKYTPKHIPSHFFGSFFYLLIMDHLHCFSQISSENNMFFLILSCYTFMLRYTLEKTVKKYCTNVLKKIFFTWHIYSLQDYFENHPSLQQLKDNLQGWDWVVWIGAVVPWVGEDNVFWIKIWRYG